jgi:hypothetical protein
MVEKSAYEKGGEPLEKQQGGMPSLRPESWKGRHVDFCDFEGEWHGIRLVNKKDQVAQEFFMGRILKYIINTFREVASCICHTTYQLL